MAGDVVDKMWQQRAERRTAHWPTVHEQHIGPAANPTVGNLGTAHIEEPFGRLPEQVGGVLRRKVHGAVPRFSGCLRNGEQLVCSGRYIPYS